MVYCHQALFLYLNLREEKKMREKIASAANKKIKLVQSLQKKKFREQEQKFLAEGIRLAEMAIASDWSIDFAFCTLNLFQHERGVALLESLQEKNIPCYELDEKLFAKISTTETSQGILLVVDKKKNNLQDLQVKQKALYVVLDGVQDPGNAGTIVRTADAVGADGVIFLQGSVDAFADKTVRATMGSLFHLPVCTNVSTEELQKFLQEHQIKLLATALDATAKPHFAEDFTQSCAIVFGNEGNGASQEILQAAEKIYIPMYGQAESLNVGMSAAIVLYEAIRQRNFA